VALDLNQIDGVIPDDDKIEVLAATIWLDQIDQAPQAKGIAIRKVRNDESPETPSSARRRRA
jgi:ribosomal protein S12